MISDFDGVHGQAVGATALVRGKRFVGTVKVHARALLNCGPRQSLVTETANICKQSPVDLFGDTCAHSLNASRTHSFDLLMYCGSSVVGKYISLALCDARTLKHDSMLIEGQPASISAPCPTVPCLRWLGVLQNARRLPSQPWRHVVGLMRQMDDGLGADDV